MDFLARHFEKLILVVCLLCLLWGVKYIGDAKKSAEALTDDTDTKLRTIVKGKKMLASIEDSELKTLDSMLTLPQNQVNAADQRPDGADLISPTPLIICKNPECGFVFPFADDECPQCHAAQDRIAPPPQITDDLDGDGIPDLIEKADSKLDYRYRYDANDDYDGDGFLNVEEYRAERDIVGADKVFEPTYMHDPAKTPALGYMLRCRGKAELKDIPFILKRIKDGGGSTDPNDWKASLIPDGAKTSKDLSLKEGKNKITARGVTYTLVRFAPDHGSIVVSNSAGKEYTMKVPSENDDGRVRETEYTVSFAFLAGHDRLAYGQAARRPPLNEQEMKRSPEADDAEAEKSQNRRRPPRGGMVSLGMDGFAASSGSDRRSYIKVFTLHANSTFILHLKRQKPGDGAQSGEEERVVEYYRVLPVENPGADNETIKVQQISALDGGSSIGAPITVPRLDESERSIDFLRGSGTRGSYDGMMQQGGMPGMPGMPVTPGMPGMPGRIRRN